MKRRKVRAKKPKLNVDEVLDAIKDGHCPGCNSANACQDGSLCGYGRQHDRL